MAQDDPPVSEVFSVVAFVIPMLLYYLLYMLSNSSTFLSLLKVFG